MVSCAPPSWAFPARSSCVLLGVATLNHAGFLSEAQRCGQMIPTSSQLHRVHSWWQRETTNVWGYAMKNPEPNPRSHIDILSVGEVGGQIYHGLPMDSDL